VSCAFVAYLFVAVLHVYRLMHAFPPRRSSDLLRDCCAPVGSSRCTPTARQQPHETIVPPSHLKRKLTDTESESRQPLQMFGLVRSEEHTSELQSRLDLVCRLPLEKKKVMSNPP